MEFYMIDLTNCPNCGAPIQDYICSYCGTVFPSNINAFHGRKAIVIATDDENRLLLLGINIRSIEESHEYATFYSGNVLNSVVDTETEVSIEGYLYDDKALMHNIHNLKDLLNEKL